jgi:oligopeptidase B
VWIFCSAANAQNAPVAKTENHKDTLPGHIVDDPYHWMEDLQSKDVLEYIKAENAHTKITQKKLADLSRMFYKGLDAHPFPTPSRPDLKLFEKPEGDYIYYRKKSGLTMLLCRKPRNSDKEMVILNARKAARRMKDYELMLYKISPDQQKSGYIIANDATHDAVLKIETVATKRLVDRLSNVVSFVWFDDQTVLYTPFDKLLNKSRDVYRHVIGTPQSSDVLLYHEESKNSMVDVKMSASGKYVWIEVLNNFFTEYLYLDKNQTEPQQVYPRADGIRYHVEHYASDTVFHILTNKNAPNYKYVSTGIRHISENHWNEIIPESDSRLNYVVHIENGYIVETYKDWSTDLKIVDKNTKQETAIGGFLDPAHHIQRIFIDTVDQIIRFKYCSIQTSDVYYDYHVKTNRLVKLFETHVKNYKKEDYIVEVKNVMSHDSLPIPVIIMYGKNTRRDGSALAQMSVYGAYGAQYRPSFDHNLPALLDMGFVYVRCDVRGGGGEGTDWHIAGSAMHKKNTAYDVVSIAKYLAAEKYASPQNIYATGSSGGGIALGMVANMFPDVLRGITLRNPKLDVLFEKDMLEWTEFGNPTDTTELEYMLEFSPYQNVRKQSYPAMLFLTGYQDENVPCCETLKMVARLRANNTGNNPILLNVDMAGNHYRLHYKKMLNVNVFKLALFNGML